MSNRDSIEADDAEAIKAIEDMIVGSGAEDFRELERMVDVFCPFEAIGMVNQEIRHSNYLAYILDPNRPHGFGDTLLQAFLQLVADSQDYNFGFSKMDLHFWDGARASVRREWKNIDLLIELPTPNEKGKGLVVAVELKINAKESDDQLKNYQSTIEKEYKNWKQAFVFLTKSEDVASGDNADLWMPLGMETLLDHLGETVKHQQFSGPSAELFDAYDAMMRRHHLSNNDIDELVAKLWSKHKEALEAICDRRPDLYGDIRQKFTERQSLISERLGSKVHLDVVCEKSTKSIIRFGIQNWDQFDGMMAGTDKWLSSGRLVAIEVWTQNGGLKTSFVIGPSPSDFRQELFKEFLESTSCKKHEISLAKPKSRIAKNWQHLAVSTIVSKENFSEMEQGVKEFDGFAEDCILAFVEYWAKKLPVIDKLISNLFQSK